MPTNEQKAYFAGFFDGEGCIAAKIAKTRNINILVVQQDPRPLYLLNSVYGGSVRFRKNNIFVWYCPTDNRKTFLEDLLPFLTVKKEVALLALELLKFIPKKGSGKWMSINTKKQSYESRKPLLEKISRINGAG